MMSSPLKQQPEEVADKVLRRAELGKMARRLQNRLALAHFKTRHGWEDLTLDTIEPKVEEELRRKRHTEGEIFSDSSSSASDLPYPSANRRLMSSPLKAPFFSDAIGSSNGSSAGQHRKRTYQIASFDQPPFLSSAAPSPSNKRFRASPTAHRSFTAGSGHSAWKDNHQLAQSSPIKPRRQQHFTTSNGPDVSFFQTSRRISDALESPNFNALTESDDDSDDLPGSRGGPIHSFRAPTRSSPPSTPPMRNRSLNRRGKEKNGKAAGGTSKQEGVDLLLYLAQSPSPAQPRDKITSAAAQSRMDPPSTPPQRNNALALPSSMMNTPGGGSLFPTTPGQPFDFSDFVNITPSPAQKPWKTPMGLGVGRTPRSAARRPLTFDEGPVNGLGLPH